jgi:hypothetical protein
LNRNDKKWKWDGIRKTIKGGPDWKSAKIQQIEDQKDGSIILVNGHL